MIGALYAPHGVDPRVGSAHFMCILTTGRYGTSSGPDGKALVAEVEELNLTQLEALRRCFSETRAHMQAGQARLQREDLPEISASPSDMLHFLVHREAESIGGHLSHLEYMDGIVAREQQRRSTRPDMGTSPQ